MPGEIIKDSVVTLHYTVSDPDGTVFDDGSKPLVYLHGGYGGIFTKLEEALHGRKIGDRLTIKLQPQEAFGDYDEDLVVIEDADLFPENAEIGMTFERVSDAGEEIFRITDIADGKVVVDGNHPLAGVALVFDLTVASVRAATAEEIAHGHTHEEDDEEDEDEDEDDDHRHGGGGRILH
ncbi:MAG: peptidylprolyl isomerase [Azoarcus sp.]|jgi:FKBP-type peptidyl-prolyl cis-trans isomerase SlyD|nr:peptidylprolyl isomerase [Azoarcus sp.]